MLLLYLCPSVVTCTWFVYQQCTYQVVALTAVDEEEVLRLLALLALLTFSSRSKKFCFMDELRKLE